MNVGCQKTVHHPVVLTAFSGRNDETSRPNVGIVQKKTKP